MFVIYTDGACSGNPGPGGYGAVVLIDNKVVKEFSGGSQATTNNRMELAAAIVALRSTPTGSSCKVFTDSKYVQDGITKWIKGWLRCNWVKKTGGVVKNRDLWKKLHDLDKARHIDWIWVKGHSGNKWNERCDELAKAGIPTAGKK